jgi:hypothetical protein
MWSSQQTFCGEKITTAGKTNDAIQKPPIVKVTTCQQRSIGQLVPTTFNVYLQITTKINYITRVTRRT